MTTETILPTPDIFSAQRVLCIQPHYDDNDIAAGGIIRKLRQNGAEIHYLTVTDDLMGVVDDSLSPQEAAQALLQDQFAAGEIIGVQKQYWLNYPDAGEYNRFAVRRDMLKVLRIVQPDFVLTPDPWLTYEAHRDHVQTGLVAAEAVMFAGFTKIASGDPQVDAAYPANHEIRGIAFYYTREPNYIANVDSVWETKLAAVRCYKTQFMPHEMDQLLAVLTMKSRQVAADMDFEHGEPLKVLHPDALHGGL